MRISLPLLALASFAACADPEDPDAGTPDLGFADAGFADSGPRPDATPDASTPDSTPLDATPDDAGMFTVALTTSSTVVTDDTAILLTATPMGETSTVVDFYEGTSYLGSASPPAPFTFSLDFTAGQNGTHLYHAEASANGGRAISNDVTIEVRIPRGSYVDPTSGLDTNRGTLAEPFKTIRHAASVSTPGDSIFLLDGQYDLANQGSGFGTFCPSVTITASVSVRAVNAGNVTLLGVTSGCAFTFNGSGDVYGVRFSGFQQALTFYSGHSVISESSFDAIGIGVFVNDTAKVRMEAPSSGPYFTNYQNLAFGVPVAVVEETAELTVVGGTFEGLPSYGIGMFLARANGRLTMEGVTIRDNGRAALRVYDNAHAILRDSLIDNCSGTGLNAEVASINIGAGNTQGVDDIGLELERTQILSSNAHGISVVFYNNRPTHLLVSLIDSRITDHTGTAILVDGAGVPAPGLNVDVRLRNSVILGGTRGIFGLAANVDIDGGEVSGATGVGITLGYSGFPNRLTVRNATFDGNGDDTIRITDPAVIVDLGTTLDPGANTMSAIPTGASAIALTAALTADAVGNTWMASAQGADATGHYPAATTVTGPANGLNYELVAGASLVLEP